MELLGDLGHVESCFFPFGDSVIVGARLVHGLPRRTIGSKIIWTHLMELLGAMGHLESQFFLFGDSVSVGAR